MGNSSVTGARGASSDAAKGTHTGRSAARVTKLRKDRAKEGTKQIETVGPYSANSTLVTPLSSSTSSSSTLAEVEGSGTGLSLMRGEEAVHKGENDRGSTEGGNTSIFESARVGMYGSQLAQQPTLLPPAPAALPPPPPPLPPPAPPLPSLPSTQAEPTGLSADRRSTSAPGVPAEKVQPVPTIILDGSTLVTAQIGALTEADLEAAAEQQVEVDDAFAATRQDVPHEHAVLGESSAPLRQPAGSHPVDTNPANSPQQQTSTRVVRTTWTPPHTKGGLQVHSTKGVSPQPTATQRRWRQHSHEPHVAHQELPDLQPYHAGQVSMLALSATSSSDTSAMQLRLSGVAGSSHAVPDVRTPAVSRREHRATHTPGPVLEGSASQSYSVNRVPLHTHDNRNGISAAHHQPSLPSWPLQTATFESSSAPTAIGDEIARALQLYQDIQKQYYLDFYTRIFQQQQQQQQQPQGSAASEALISCTAVAPAEPVLPASTVPVAPAVTAPKPVLRVHSYAPQGSTLVHRRIPTTTVDLTRSLSPRSAVHFSSVAVPADYTAHPAPRAGSPSRGGSRMQGPEKPYLRSPGGRSRADRMAAAKTHTINH